MLSNPVLVYLFDQGLTREMPTSNGWNAESIRVTRLKEAGLNRSQVIHR
jgi:hypothetical protein